MEAKHTPGPWDITASVANDGRLIVENDLGLPVCAMSLRGVQGDAGKMSANAKLIAAAPDLLEALRGLVAQVDAGTSPEYRALQEHRSMRVARAAIARATA